MSTNEITPDTTNPSPHSCPQAPENYSTRDTNWTRVVNFTEKALETILKVVEFALKIFRRVIELIFLWPILLADKLIEKSVIVLSYDHQLKPGDMATVESQATNLQVLGNPEEIHKKKIEILKKAEKSIEISGFCGGKSFDEVLGIIEQKLTAAKEHNTTFKARILPNISQLSDQNKIKLAELEKNYPEHFAAIIAPSVTIVGFKLERFENHIKMIVVDDKYCVSGSSNHVQDANGKSELDGAIGALAGGYTDIDLYGEGEMASDLKTKFDKIFTKWQNLTGKSVVQKSEDQESFVANNQKEITSHPQIQKIEIITSHYEQKEQNAGLNAYITAIQSAKKSITICNMSVNNESITSELIAALDRKVNIKIITNGPHEKAPPSAGILATRSRPQSMAILSASHEKSKEKKDDKTQTTTESKTQENKSKTQENKSGKAEIHEYQEPGFLLHTKAMIIDEETDEEATVLLGSFNLTNQSARRDDECIFKIKSKDVATQVMTPINAILEKSNKLEFEELNNNKRYTYLGRFLNHVLEDMRD